MYGFTKGGVWKFYTSNDLVNPEHQKFLEFFDYPGGVNNPEESENPEDLDNPEHLNNPQDWVKPEDLV